MTLISSCLEMMTGREQPSRVNAMCEPLVPVRVKPSASKMATWTRQLVGASFGMPMGDARQRHVYHEPVGLGRGLAPNLPAALFEYLVQGSPFETGFDKELHGRDEVSLGFLPGRTPVHDIQGRAQRHNPAGLLLDEGRGEPDGEHEGGFALLWHGLNYSQVVRPNTADFTSPGSHYAPRKRENLRSRLWYEQRDRGLALDPVVSRHPIRLWATEWRALFTASFLVLI